MSFRNLSPQEMFLQMARSLGMTSLSINVAHGKGGHGWGGNRSLAFFDKYLKES